MVNFDLVFVEHSSALGAAVLIAFEDDGSHIPPPWAAFIPSPGLLPIKEDLARAVFRLSRVRVHWLFAFIPLSFKGSWQNEMVLFRAKRLLLAEPSQYPGNRELVFSAKPVCHLPPYLMLESAKDLLRA